MRCKILGAAFLMSLFTGLSAHAETEVSLWYHGAGNEVELGLINTLTDDFNSSQSDYKVVIEEFPQESYNDSVEAAALAGNLPCIIDVDGPVMPRWAWAEYLQPLPIDDSKIAEFLPGTKGIWNDTLYSIGLWDAAIALYARQSTLDELNLRTPTLEKPWDKDEFMAALDAAKQSENYTYALDLGMAWTGEWYPYAFGPFLQSFGGDMVDRSNYKSAEGVLNGEAALAFGEWWQSLFTEGYAPGTSQDAADRDTGFIEGNYAFAWNGNWAAVATIDGGVDDLLFLPAPDFGNGSTIGAASWQFGISKNCDVPEGALAWIENALQDKYLAAFSDNIGLIPSTPSAAQMTQNYSPEGQLEVFFGLSESQALVRPVTPAYPVIAKVFEKALADIANGADVADTLDAAVDEIDSDIEANNGYEK
ncbi:MAG: extracellular solute-binding protein [Granulosicoccus sp.]|nr:extracellular solute-binding protein [Granulosicoccus sp.]